MLLTLVSLVVAQGPFLPANPDWTRQGSQAYEYLGRRAENAGDINGDGRDDLIILADGANAQSGVHGWGRAELYFGTPTGYPTTPDWCVRGDLGNQSVNWAAAGIGDVNNDGFGDLAVSSRRWNGGSDPGGVHVFYGGPLGPNGGQDALMNEADWVALGSASQQVAFFGVALLGPGDVDGDSIDDLLISATNTTRGETYEGAVFLFPGSQNGLTPGPVASYTDATWSVVTNRTHGYLGRSLHAVGDVDGDGRDDFAIRGEGGPQDPTLWGRYWVFTGCTGGMWQDIDSIAFATLGNGGVNLGRDIAAADFNRDGYSDIVLAFPQSRVNGLIEPLQLWLGGQNGFTLSPWTVTSVPWFEQAGTALAAGHLDTDGIPDLAILSTLYSGPNGTGRVRVLRGIDHPTEPLMTAPAWEVTPRLATGGASGLANTRLEIVGDPEGDGTHALAIANPSTLASGLDAAGGVDLFTNVGESPDACPVARPRWAIDEDTWLGLRHEVQLADVNGDGHDDAVVCGRSSPHVRVYYGSARGLAETPGTTIGLGDPEASRGLRPVAVGDVDADGDDDVLLLRNGRAYLASTGIGQYVPAQAYLLEGNPTQPGITWAAVENVTDPVHFATSGAILDLDGDGFDDVVLGAPGHERDPWLPQDPYDIPGAVYAYYGGPQGVHNGVTGTLTNATWSATDGNSSGRFGRRIRSAGDLDGDEDEELLVAAPLTRDANGAYVGALYLWLGHEDGVNAGNPGVAATAPWSRVGTEPGGTLGSVCEAGVDVTGDGIPDLATRRMTGGWMEGVEVWRGTSSGFAATPVLVPVPEVFKLLPDFTSDGIGDIVFARPQATVRTPGNGQVAVLHGGADMTRGLLRWRTAGAKARVFLNQPLHPVRGDVNGDGRSDLLLTSIWYRQSESEDRARVTLYYGTGDPLLQLSNQDVTAGQTIGVDHFGGEPNQAVFLVPDLHSGQPHRIPLAGPEGVTDGTILSEVAGRLGRRTAWVGPIWARGVTDATCCWHTDWTIPARLLAGNYRVQTVMLPFSNREITSETVTLTVR